MLFTINVFVLLLLSVLFVGSLLPLSSNPHWFIRGWEFPRVQIIILSLISCTALAGTNWIVEGNLRSTSTIAICLTLLICGWHLFRILPYTRLLPKQAQDWQEQEDPFNNQLRRLRMLISNVEMENNEYSLWRDVVLACDPDVMIVAEIDESWKSVLESLKESYPNQVLYPQDNWYGLAIISRLPLLESELHFLVQNDVPAIDAEVELPSGDQVRLIAVHPRPPEPIRGNDAVARDAELALWGKELGDYRNPVVIGGDLNDVAWSDTTRLFLRLSGMLDPRRGRGLYNTFHADHPWMRFPLDHVFHSPHFTVRHIQRLDYVGSDHFPIFIDLQFQPSQMDQQNSLEEKQGDESEAEELIDRAKNPMEVRS